MRDQEAPRKYYLLVPPVTVLKDGVLMAKGIRCTLGNYYLDDQQAMMVSRELAIVSCKQRNAWGNCRINNHYCRAAELKRVSGKNMQIVVGRK